MSEHEHPHTAADGSEIRHEDMLTVGVHRAHYHEGDDLVYVRPNGTSVHYPDIDGQPDPRSRDPQAEALLDEALGLLVRARADVYMRWCIPSECAMTRDTDAFLDRDEVKARLAAQEEGAP